ncbi:FAD-binding oxidoreductase [Paraburkholderia sp. UYCP14C]|uniref:FAD-binding oxidoreductase n=1 Tax=Paraburkholderia sp. UYCP14C TaxID=2511130 RepID=UPI0010229FA2|nr:FAD-binding oxidoreductase [Paraburkholderia sp. UYCP14C]RZF25612.1 FAD-binding oxidoreductase [Paraburkholderia sp. UYCP14C]
MSTETASLHFLRGESHAASRQFEQLRGTLHGTLVMPRDPDYDDARRVWNGTVDKRPAMIVYCADADDVVAAVRFARSIDSRVAVRSGGHNVAGLSVCDAGMVIDLSRMKQIDVDAEWQVVRAEAGLNLGEFDRATMAHGLATTTGVISDTGLAGLTLGGGFGKLGRKYGLTCDNLVAVEIVTADGQKRLANDSEHPDLFWAVRGGGGNFGIATALYLRLHPLNPELLVCSLLYPFEQARAALRFYDRYARNAPDEVSADAAFVTNPSGERFFSISACYVGAPESGRQVLEPLMEFGSPIDCRLERLPYLQIQSGGDDVFPRGRRYYWKAQFMKEIDAGAIDAILGAYERSPSLSSLLVFQHVGGAIARVAGSATAYQHRDACFDCFPVAIWDETAEDAVNVQWARGIWEALRPYSCGGVYANNLGDEGDERVKEAYGDNYARLASVKRQYDPDNFFRMNQNIAPA